MTISLAEEMVHSIYYSSQPYTPHQPRYFDVGARNVQFLAILHIFSLHFAVKSRKDVFSKNKIIGCEKEHFTYISDNSCLIK